MYDVYIYIYIYHITNSGDKWAGIDDTWTSLRTSITWSTDVKNAWGTWGKYGAFQSIDVGNDGMQHLLFRMHRDAPWCTLDSLELETSQEYVLEDRI